MTVVRVMVEGWLIEDGQYPFPEIGDRAHYAAQPMPTTEWLHSDGLDACDLFDADFVGSPNSTDVAGTVVARRLVTVTSGPHAPTRTILSDVPAGRRGFSSGLVPTRVVHRNPDGSGWVTMEPPTDQPWVRETGVLVDLALDT